MQTQNLVLAIVRVEHDGDYRLRLSFNDGTNRVVDFQTFLQSSKHPEIRKYLDTNCFRQYSLVHGDLVWNDYDLCFPVADLYEGNL